MRVGSLCTGYGGIEMALALAGERPDLRWIAETNPGLAAMHAVPNLGDVRLIEWDQVEPVDLMTMGVPCQPVSAAGRRRGESDERWLWPHAARGIAEMNPVRVLFENVRNLVSIQKGELWAGILEDLATLGYDVRWLTIGACRVGMAHHRHRLFALATRAPYGRPADPATRVEVAECGLKAPLVGLPSPAARDGDKRRGDEGTHEYWRKRAEVRNNGMPLGAAVALLPTPQQRDGHNRGVPSEATATARFAAGRRNLDDGIALLPTPTQLMPTPRATDGVNGGPNQRGRKGDLAMPSAVQPERWGRFVEAVARQASILGVAPPEPTEPNRNGSPRLSPRFAEWLMAIPAGHVTSALGRNDALMAIGNGVCPPQCVAAWEILNQASA